VQSGDADVGVRIGQASDHAQIKFTGVDNVLDDSESVYRDVDNNDLVSDGDFRVHAELGSSLPGGQTLSCQEIGGAPDCGIGIHSPEDVTHQILMGLQDLVIGVDRYSAFYLTHSPGQSTVQPDDLRVSPVSFPAGTFVAPGNSDTYGQDLAHIDPALVAVCRHDTDGDSFASLVDRLYLQVACGQVEPGSLRLGAVPTPPGPPYVPYYGGSIVGPDDVDVGAGTTMTAGARLAGVDVNGNHAYDQGEPIVIAFGSEVAVTAGDVLLTPVHPDLLYRLPLDDTGLGLPLVLLPVSFADIALRDVTPRTAAPGDWH
jgi:hypothetical protein